MEAFQALLAEIPLANLLKAALVMALGLIFVRIARTTVRRITAGRLSNAHALLARRIITTVLLLLTLGVALQQLGVDLSLLFGAAGIVTLALGFASQTSASNLIAGIFLIGDDTFTVGDVITVGGVSGEVIAIDLLSVKLRKFDNILVRIPNETLIKTQVETSSRYPIRRIQLTLRLPFDESVEKLTEALLAAADRDPLLLDEPAPVVTYAGFADSGLELAIYVWAAREHFQSVKNTLQANILDEIRKRNLRLAVNEHHIEMTSPGSESPGSESHSPEVNE